jgi:hypothetical protein
MLRKPSLHTLKRSRFLLLLLALLAVFLASPFLDNSRLHAAYLLILFASIMLSAVHMTSEKVVQRIFALVIGGAWLALSLWGLVGQYATPTIAANFLFLVFSVYVLGSVLGSVISRVDVDFDTLLAAVSAYLLIGLIWAVSYIVIHQLDPEAFHLIHDEARPYFHQFLYFSLTTLTTLGYGDITALSPFAQIWATMEAVVGTLYMALLVARLVGMYQSQRSGRR